MPEPGGSHGSLRTRALPAAPEEAALAPSSSRPAMLRAWRIGRRLTQLADGGRHLARGGNARQYRQVDAVATRQDDAAATWRDDAAVTRRDGASKPAVYPWAVQLALSMQRGNQTRPGFHPYSHFGVCSHLGGV